MEVVRQSVYDYPKYYDVLFGSDWKAEYDFLCDCFEYYAKRPVRRVFEPACGTGRLLFRFAQAGYEVAGLDLNEKAVEYCNRRFQRLGLSAHVWVGDMADFRVKRKYDAAFNTINSFRHLTDDKSAMGHLACMREALAKGGLYILGFHLTPNRPPKCTEESWVVRRGHLQVNSWMKTLSLDRQRREEKVYLQFDVYTPRRSFRIVNEFVFRTYTWQQFHRLLQRVGGWEIAGTHDFAYRIDEPITVDDYTEDVVYVLRRV
ncbi:MAG: class I SAM-dependent methyltransferase [Thermogutta sp.]|nr:class I SAM-dependent methyltransferase [Thermogutta sp.]HOP76720.1 class I SAM-dependent methyltransferase [Thermogutta sp.]HPU05157.1 class I SAM-dependent methyltransferase [Thermogutta sp.]HPZ84487.1 class I SAM-dependent methyltransferase [Thermogutta sp.]HQF12773.1 class I SAM-dependent methyltransferase [Thermogutta sp.]